MKRYVIAAFAFCLIISFQNCSPHHLSDVNNANALSNPTLVTPTEKVDVSQTEMVEIPESAYLESQLQQDITAASPTSTFSAHHLEIDVKTGVVHVVDQNNEVLVGLQYCLNSSDMSELHTILDSAKVCEDQAVEDGQVCTAEYRFPYAKLHFLDSEISLGEALSGCNKGPDLCGDQKDMLQGLLTHIQGDLATRKCEFQVVQQ
ncbi:MAG: hypothetical protein ACXWRE_00735 [Pseudobdellovibrionaceae bacterium]